MSRIALQLRWLIGLRLVAITSAVIPSIFLRLTSEKPPYGDPELYWIAGFTLVASLLYLVLHWALAQRPDLQLDIQLVGDLLLVTALVAAFGGVYSPFSILYLVVIACASILQGRRRAVRIAGAACIIYGVTIVALYLGWPPALIAAEDEPVSLGRLAYNLAIHGFGFVALALMTSHLTEERRLKSDLADLEVQHRDVVESIPSGLITTDPDGTVTRVNRAGLEILGLPAAELLGRTLSEVGLVPVERWRRVTGEGASSQEGSREEVEWRPRGESRYIGFSTSPLTLADGSPSGFVFIFQDLTGWRKLQEEVRIKDRMAAVGELAAGIAHEIGNPLAAISGSVQMLSAAPGMQPAQQKLLEIVHKESQRLDRAIKGFLRFARPRDRTNVPFDIAGLLRENFELLGNSQEILPGHRLELDLGAEEISTLGDADQITQIFWNLCRNALRAMPDGGVLSVEGRLVEGLYRIRFRDTGRGMSEAERTNLFHPFQSFFDHGTGIGMAIVYRIVHEHSGRMTVESEPGRGTTITVELPVVGSAAPVSVGS